jgi:hypothetical protein
MNIFSGRNNWPGFRQEPPTSTSETSRFPSMIGLV